MLTTNFKSSPGKQTMGLGQHTGTFTYPVSLLIVISFIHRCTVFEIYFKYNLIESYIRMLM